MVALLGFVVRVFCYCRIRFNAASCTRQWSAAASSEAPLSCTWAFSGLFFHCKPLWCYACAFFYLSFRSHASECKPLRCYACSHLFGTRFPPAPLLGGASDKHAYLLGELCIVINLLLDFRSPWGRLLCVRLLSCLHLNGSLSAFLTDGWNGPSVARLYRRYHMERRRNSSNKK